MTYCTGEMDRHANWTRAETGALCGKKWMVTLTLASQHMPCSPHIAPELPHTRESLPFSKRCPLSS